jgi:peptidyl-prolyl cis-trans isomerase B (cyclophilin B)
MVKFLIPLFALALLIGCSPQDAMQNDATSSDSSMMEDKTNPVGFNGELLEGKHTVVLKTTLGDITLEIDADAAPKAATNFVTLSQMGYYDGLKFHRVIPGFMIQAGDPNGDGTGGTSIFGESFEDEPNDLQMVRGVIAMANRGPNTNGSQFFIVQAEGTPWLQGRHTIFGKVVDGMDVVDAITKVPRDANDAPNDPITYDAEVEE